MPTSPRTQPLGPSPTRRRTPIRDPPPKPPHDTQATPQPPRHATHAADVFHPSLHSITFAACYVYSPRGHSYACKASRLLCTRLKLADPIWLPTYAGQVLDQTLRHRVLATLFSKDAVLVPVPGSSSSSKTVWAAEQLAVALNGVGLGTFVWPALQRRFPVRKSATALTAERPTVRQHYDSFTINKKTPTADRFILIDDVITKGRTIFAAALRLYEAFPHADIRAFALVRTLGFLRDGDLTQPLKPCQGVIRWAGGDARRDP